MGAKLRCLAVFFYLFVLFVGVYPVNASLESKDHLAGSFDGVWENVDGLLVTQPLIQTVYRRFTGADELAAARAIQHDDLQTTYDKLYWMAQEEYGEEDAIPLIFAAEPLDEYFSDVQIKREDLQKTLEFVPVAYDALVFFVHADNPVSDISSREMAEVYAGNISGWQTLGGKDFKIKAFQRPWASYSQKMLEHMLMPGKQFAKPPVQWIYTDEGSIAPEEVHQAYDNAQAALGYTMHYYYQGMYGGENRKLLSMDGILPDEDTIRTGEYPFRTAYYAIFPKSTPEDHPIRALVSWLLHSEGQRVVKSVGMIPLADVGEDAFAQPEPYAENETRQSKGTGGILNRNAEPHTYSPQSFWGMRPSYPWGRHACWEAFVIDLPEASPVRQRIEGWRMGARQELAKTNPAGAGDIQEYVFYNGNIVSFYLCRGTGYDTVIKTAVFDLKAGEQLRLSDLFLDGFNYVDYINQTLLQRSFRQGGEALGMFALEEDNLKRSFSGLPADYPYFVLTQEGTVSIAFPGMNPFVQVPGFQDMFFADVPVWHDISPFGGCKIEESYTHIKNDEKKAYCDVLSIRIDDGRYPEIERAVNDKLAQGAENFLKMADTQPVKERPDLGGSVSCMPFHETYGDYHSFAVEAYEAFSSYSPTMGGFIVDLHTGRAMLTDEQAKALANHPAASFMYKEGGAPLWEDMQEISKYSVSEDSVVHSIWLDTNADHEKLVVVELMEADGSCVRISVPVAVIDF